jgi:hypothetical protein
MYNKRGYGMYDISNAAELKRRIEKEAKKRKKSLRDFLEQDV